jgi:hypothetical protein
MKYIEMYVENKFVVSEDAKIRRKTVKIYKLSKYIV